MGWIATMLAVLAPLAPLPAGVSAQDPEELAQLMRRCEELRGVDASLGLELAEDAGSLADELGDRTALAEVANLRGHHLGALGRMDEAMSAHLEAIELARALGSRRIEGGGLLRLAAVHATIGEHAAATRRAEEARAVLGISATGRELASIENTLAMACQFAGDLDGAVDHYFSALEHARVDGIDEYLPGLLMNIGTVKTYQGDHRGALDVYVEAVDTNERMGRANDNGQVWNAIGLAHLELGEPAEAVAAFEICLDLAEGTSNDDLITMVSRSLAFERRRGGDPALEISRRGLEAARRGSNPHYLALALCCLGEGLLMADDYEGVLTVAREARPIAERLEIRELSRNVERLLAGASAELGYFEAAFDHQNRYVELQQEILREKNNADAARRLAAAEFEIEQLRERAAAARQRMWRDAGFLGIAVLLVALWIVNRASRQRARTNATLEQQNREITAINERVLTLNGQLSEALAEVKRLGGLLPICARCKDIRDDDGYWKRVESYISDHSEAEFTHSICPQCARELYPEIEVDA